MKEYMELTAFAEREPAGAAAEAAEQREMDEGERAVREMAAPEGAEQREMDEALQAEQDGAEQQEMDAFPGKLGMSTVYYPERPKWPDRESAERRKGGRRSCL